MSTILKTTHLSKVYGSQKAVDNLNLNIQEGEVYGFLGRNGAGKTTTIRMLLGLISPSEGEVEIFGQSLKKHSKKILPKIGSIVEFPGFYYNLTAKENLLINAKLIGVQKKKAIDEALEIAGLTHEDGKLVGKYSLGMKQRLGIARAILHNPELLILDEPTNGLDPVGIKEIRNLMHFLAHQKKMTILVSSHILSEVEQLVDRIGIIHNGQLLEELPLEELRKRNRKYLEIRVSNQEKVTMLLETQLNILDYEVHENGLIRIYDKFNDAFLINKTLMTHKIEISRLALSEDKLEDYFINLTGGAIK